MFPSSSNLFLVTLRELLASLNRRMLVNRAEVFLYPQAIDHWSPAGSLLWFFEGNSDAAKEKRQVASRKGSATPRAPRNRDAAS
jgi:hypothetical protein